MSHIAVVEGSVKRIRQLTGEWERSPRDGFRIRTPSATRSNFGIVGTDLGSSFFDGERLWFLFGDTWPDGNLGDSFAYTTDPDPNDGLTLRFLGGRGWWKRPSISGRPATQEHPAGFPTGGFEVPTGGFALGGRRYVFFTSDHFEQWVDGMKWHVMGSSALCRQRADGTDLADLQFLFEFSRQQSSGRFVNASPVLVPDPPPGLPFDGPAVLVWGSGTYRRSHCYLAAVSAAVPARGPRPVEDYSQWWFLTRLRDGVPAWTKEQHFAMPMFAPPDVGGDGGIGELSAAYVPALGVWLLTYGGVTFRTATRPWGPWSVPQTLDNAAAPAIALGTLLHRTWDDGGVTGTDPLYDPGRGMDGGGPYGPYLIDRFTRSAGPNRAQIYFTLSTWNPYQAHLMTAILERRPGDIVIDPDPPVFGTAGLGFGRDHLDPGRPRLPLPIGGLAMLRSRFGPAGNNFELIAPSLGGGLLFTAARNDPWPPAWGPTEAVGLGPGPVPVEYTAAAIALAIDPDNKVTTRDRLTVAATTGDRVVYLYHEPITQPYPSWAWHGPYPVVAVEADDSRHPLISVRGNPALLASTLGAKKANIELLVPDGTAGIRHYWFDNDPDFPLSPEWRLAPTFGTGLGRIDAVAAIQSVFGDPTRGNLEVVARRGGELQLFWRDAAMTWHDPAPLVAEGVPVTAATGIPAFLQSRYGPGGNDFQLVTPWQGGGLACFWRDNGAAEPAKWRWHGPAVLDPGTPYLAAALVAGPFGPAPGNLELVATAGNGTIRHFYRESTGTAWHDAGVIGI